MGDTWAVIGVALGLAVAAVVSGVRRTGAPIDPPEVESPPPPRGFTGASGAADSGGPGDSATTGASDSAARRTAFRRAIAAP